MGNITTSISFEDPKKYLVGSGPIWIGQERVQEFKNFELTKQMYDEIHRRASSVDRMIGIVYIYIWWYARAAKKKVIEGIDGCWSQGGDDCRHQDSGYQHSGELATVSIQNKCDPNLGEVG